jgi:hypothetical protein
MAVFAANGSDQSPLQLADVLVSGHHRVRSVLDRFHSMGLGSAEVKHAPCGLVHLLHVEALRRHDIDTGGGGRSPTEVAGRVVLLVMPHAESSGRDRHGAHVSSTKGRRWRLNAIRHPLAA